LPCTCDWGRLEEIRAAGEPEGEVLCIRSDLGYQPSSWLPTKIAVAAGGGVLAGVMVLAWRHHVFAGLALVVLFTAIMLAWYLPDGYRSPFRARSSFPRWSIVTTFA
jgi:hypothetical protein